MRKTNDETIIKMLKEGATQKEVAAHFGVSPAAICKRLKRLAPLPESLEKLTEKEQKFAVEVAKGKTQMQAALNSFEVSSMATAKSIGSELMQKPAVKMAIKDLMEYHGMDRSDRSGKLKTHVDNIDPNVSLKALDQSWKLDGTYLEKEVEAALVYNDLLMAEEEIDRDILRLQNELRGNGDIVEGELVEETESITKSEDV